MLANRLSIGIRKTDGKEDVQIPDLQTLIQSYGMVHEWNQTRGRRYSLMSSNTDTWTAKITLLYPPNLTMAHDNREVRQELYLQAESIIEVMKTAGFQLLKPPRIILDGTGSMEGQVEGTMEVEYTT
jgi:hypothetical protein